MNAMAWAAIIGALGLGSVLRLIVEAVIRAFNGRGAAQKSRIEELARAADDADARADAEAAQRRQYAEHASELRRLLIDKGTPADQLPPWPTT